MLIVNDVDINDTRDACYYNFTKESFTTLEVSLHSLTNELLECSLKF